MSRFEVFKSRCKIQLLCRYSTADVSCRSKVLISDGENRSSMSSCRVLRSCSRKSMTRKTLVLKISFCREVQSLQIFKTYSSSLSPMTTSRSATMFSCLEAINVCISRKPVTGKPSIALSILSFLRATTSPVAISFALDTQP